MEVSKLDLELRQESLLEREFKVPNRGRIGLRVNHYGVGQMLEGLQDPQYIQQLLKTVQPDVVVEGLSIEVVEKV